MKPRGIEIWKWLALSRIALPSLPRLGRLGHLKIGPSGEEVPGGVSDSGDDTCCGGDPPPDPELLPPEYEDDPVGLELSGVMLGWIIVPRPRPPDTPNPRPCPSAPSSPGNWFPEEGGPMGEIVWPK